MQSFLQCVLLFVIIGTTTYVNGAAGEDYYQPSFINPYPRFKLYQDDGDPGEPLFLTPLIHNPNISKVEVRKKALVSGLQFLGVESYAGFLTVDPSTHSNLFFWYFPAKESPTYSPIIVWLQGGPGASSLFGLFMENGPFQFNKEGHLEKRNYTWTRTHSLIYIDNPVGTGFSFADDHGYARDEKDVARNLYEAVQQLYELFEWSSSSSFWIAGESYGGKYVPSLAYHIHHSKKTARVHIPLRGLAIGNGLSDPLHQLKYGDYLYQLGLIDEHGLGQFHVAEQQGETFIKFHEMDRAYDIFNSLFGDDSLLFNLTGFENYYNYLQPKADKDETLGKFLQSSETRRAIHVGNKTFHDLDTDNKVEEHLKLDVMASVAPWIAELLDTYKICIYNGQLDIIVAYPLTRNYLQNLKFSAANVYKIAPRQIWRVDGEVAGYIKRAGHLMEVMVRNAGHMSPMDQPKWLYTLIHEITHSTTQSYKYVGPRRRYPKKHYECNHIICRMLNLMNVNKYL